MGDFFAEWKYVPGFELDIDKLDIDGKCLICRACEIQGVPEIEGPQMQYLWRAIRDWGLCLAKSLSCEEPEKDMDDCFIYQKSSLDLIPLENGLVRYWLFLKKACKTKFELYNG